MNKYHAALTKPEFIKCPLRIVNTDFFMFECDIFKKEIDVTNFTSLSDNIDAISVFSVFLTFELRFIILF